MQHIDALKDAVVRPLWHDPDIMPEPLAPITSNQECELLIVGGGFTGLWAAMQAKERKPEADIILIEQTFVGDGASGRCGGLQLEIPELWRDALKAICRILTRCLMQSFATWLLSVVRASR